MSTQVRATTPTTAQEPTPAPADGPAPGAVDLHAVTKRYGTATAVDALDLHVRAGEFLSLLGPSGCGKTTTLRMLAGFELPDAGRIEISGASVEGLPPHRRAVNTVFQAYALFPHMDVAENVAYGLRQQKVPRAQIGPRVSDALGMVQMTGFARRKPSQLSGGQQQRVALARALVNRPAVLLLDEPMSALDRKLREEMQIELKLLQTRLGTTFVFVTHDQEEALTMSDRVAVMNEGRLEQVGGPEEVYDHPASAFVAGFVGKQNTFAGPVERLDAAGALVRAPQGAILATIAPPPAPPAGLGARGGLGVGRPAVCSVRPERVRLTAVDEHAPRADGAEAAGSADGGPNRVSGVVAGVSPLGHAVQLVVSTASGHELLVRLPRGSGVPTALGSAVTCSWEAADVHVFPAAETTPPRTP